MNDVRRGCCAPAVRAPSPTRHKARIIMRFPGRRDSAGPSVRLAARSEGRGSRTKKRMAIPLAAHGGRPFARRDNRSRSVVACPVQRRLAPGNVPDTITENDPPQLGLSSIPLAVLPKRRDTEGWQIDSKKVNSARRQIDPASPLSQGACALCVKRRVGISASLWIRALRAQCRSRLWVRAIDGARVSRVEPWLSS